MDNNDDMKEELIDLKVCHTMKILFESESLETFWCCAHKSFSSLAKRALQVLTPFSTTWLCESVFLSLLYIKSKYRNSINPENDLRVALTKKEPRFEMLLQNRKQQESRS